VDVTIRRQLSKLQPTVPDTRRNTQNSHVGSGRYWTVADERVPSNGMLYSTLINAHMLSHWYWNDAAFFTRGPVIYLPFAAQAVRQLHLFSWIFFMTVLTDPTSDQHAFL
jgi:hypothetical protein